MLIYSALIAKLRRIHTIMVSALSLKRVQVTREKVCGLICRMCRNDLFPWLYFGLISLLPM